MKAEMPLLVMLQTSALKKESKQMFKSVVIASPAQQTVA